MDNGEISVTQALNSIQSWLNADEFDKVIQGTQEILQIEPGNQRALSLLKQAQEGTHKIQKQNFKPESTHKPEATPTPKPLVTPEPAKTEEKIPDLQDQDPLANLKVETDHDIFEPKKARRKPTKGERKKLFLAMFIPAVLVVLIGGSVIWYINNRDREEIIEDIVTDEISERSTDYLKQNETRVGDLTEMANILNAYKAENGLYPELEQVESVIISNESYSVIPSDPRHGEFDKSGKVFGYMYALYETGGGASNAYILSAMFEDSRGFAYAWTQGASTKNYEDYRDLNESHVILLGEESTSVVKEEKVKVKR